MKFSVGSYDVHVGRYEITSSFSLPEFSVKGPRLWVDIDWTDNRRFPLGWCAAAGAGREVWWDGERGPFRRWGAHWSWNGPYDEPNRLSFNLGITYIRFSCPTWWKTVNTGVTEEKAIRGKTIPVVHVRHVRCLPYLEDGWPPVRFARTRWRKR